MACVTKLCGKTFGGEVYFDALLKLGGVPTEFLAACDAVVNDRLEAAGLPNLDGYGKECTPHRVLLESSWGTTRQAGANGEEKKRQERSAKGDAASCSWQERRAKKKGRRERA